MTQKQKNVTDRARESVEKAALAAVGAPTAALKALGARMSELRDTARASRKEMTSDVAREIEAWVDQGEEVIEKAMARLRESNVADELRSTARSTRDAAMVGLDKASEAAQSTLDVVEPDESLTTINGIGPSYADTLADAGVAGIAALLDRSRTDESIAELTEATGFSADTIRSWRDQIDLTRVEGIGDSYQRLLHRVGVWTHQQLASAQATVLADEMREIGLPDTPDQLPSANVIEQWRKEARRLAR